MKRDLLANASIAGAAVYLTIVGGQTACATSLLAAGAKCDGVTDDSPVVIEALACAEGAPGNCTIAATGSVVSTGGVGYWIFQATRPASWDLERSPWGGRVR